jgi:hypothetical protein
MEEEKKKKVMDYREFKLRKKNGRYRKICAPSAGWLKHQQNYLKTLYNSFEQIAEELEVEDNFHGFLKDRNCITAAAKHVGYQTTIMMDISDFFDSVNKEIIKTIDPQLASIKYFYHKEDGRTPQGFATSPVLANIAFARVVSELKEGLEEIFDMEEDDDYALTIYADDIALSLNNEDISTLNSIRDYITTFVESNGFKINRNKTRYRFAKYGKRIILGVAVGDTDYIATRKIRRKMRAAKHQCNKESLGGLTAWSRCLLPKALR